MSNITKSIIALIIIIAIGIASYFLLSNTETENGKFSKFNLSIKNLILKNGEPKKSNGEDEFNVEKFVAIISNVKDLNLDENLFKNEVFNSLNDTTITIVHNKEEEGRENPFAQIQEIKEVKEKEETSSEDKNIKENIKEEGKNIKEKDSKKSLEKSGEKSEIEKSGTEKFPKTETKTEKTKTE